MPTRLSLLYATDEEISIEASGDWDDLAPADQTLASGSDGVIDVGSPWVLTSASIDFEAAGIVAGNMVTLSSSSRSGPTRIGLAVESVSDGSVTLRRRGFAAGKGQAPFPAGATGIIFECRTFGPQIERKSWEINRELGIDEQSDRGRKPTDLHNPRDLESLCIAMVLRDTYEAQARGVPNSGEWWQKARALGAKIDEIRGRLAVRWGGEGSDASDMPSKPGFGATLTR